MRCYARGFAAMVCLLGCVGVAPYVSATDGASASATQPGIWFEDYGVATAVAKQQRKMLLVYFVAPRPHPGCERFEAQTLLAPAVVEKLKDYVLLWAPTNVAVELADKSQRLLDHPSFEEMLNRPGVAILDYAHEGASYYGCVVSEFPFPADRAYSPEQMAVILDLPPGTLTQRTMIYAVRTHPERPASTTGEFHPALAAEAERHSSYQASIRLQGHHWWGHRFQRLCAELPAGLLAREVCAESWAGQRLLESAIECVRCWRLSSGHWQAVAAPHPCYAYDIKLGANGVWYATGVFGGSG